MIDCTYCSSHPIRAFECVVIRVSVGTVSLNPSSACESLAELERILGLLRKFCTGEYQKPKKKRFCGCVQGLLNFQQLNVLGFKVKVGTLFLERNLH